MIPNFGSLEWFEWKAKLIGEAYDILSRNYKPPEPRKYDPAFSKKTQLGDKHDE